MAPFTHVRTCPAHPTTVWDVLTDFAAYGSWIPLTTMRVDDGAPRVGWGFAGLSGVGPLRFADTMLLTRWEPPGAAGSDDGDAAGRDGTHGRFAVIKTGRLLGGWADVTVEPAPEGSAVRWTEELTLRPAPVGRLARPVTDRVGAPMFARALDAMLAEAVARESVPR
ncbi:MAG TPA: SRPBCC family protein [Pedococcus sp.]|jgi:hypothetical protein